MLYTSGRRRIAAAPEEDSMIVRDVEVVWGKKGHVAAFYPSHARNHGNYSSVYASGRKKESVLHPWIHTYMITYTQHTVLGPTSSWKFCIKLDLNCFWLEMFQKHTAAAHVMYNLKSGFQMFHCVHHVAWCDTYLCIHLDIRFFFLSVLISIPWEKKSAMACLLSFMVHLLRLEPGS